MNTKKIQHNVAYIQYIATTVYNTNFQTTLTSLFNQYANYSARIDKCPILCNRTLASFRDAESHLLPFVLREPVNAIVR